MCGSFSLGLIQQLLSLFAPDDMAGDGVPTDLIIALEDEVGGGVGWAGMGWVGWCGMGMDGMGWDGCGVLCCFDILQEIWVL